MAISRLVKIGVVLALFIGLIAVIPTVRIDTNSAVSSNAFAYIRAALYFVPLDTCSVILRIIMGLWIFRVIVAILKTFGDIFHIG